MPNDKIGERVARFGSSLRGTQSYWNKSRAEMTNMINQQGTRTFFFTISEADTKCLDLHVPMPSKAPNDSGQVYQWKVHNIISNPHITSQYMHNRFKTFFEEVLQKSFYITNYWCRYYTIYSFLFLSIYFYLYTIYF